MLSEVFALIFRFGLSNKSVRSRFVAAGAEGLGGKSAG
jgi:hypothetical protein